MDYRLLEFKVDEFEVWKSQWLSEFENLKLSDDYLFDLWVEALISKSLAANVLKGLEVWYLVAQDDGITLTDDVSVEGILLKRGILSKEFDEVFYIEGYPHEVPKKELGHTVFLDPNHALYSLHYDSEQLYQGIHYKPCFNTDEFIRIDGSCLNNEV